MLADMRIFPIQVFEGQVRPLPDSGRPSAIVKFRQSEPVNVTATGLAGDRQADLSVHGGLDKAVHVYSADHLGELARAFPLTRRPWTPGAMGENLSVSGLTEHDVCVGDVWTWGGVFLQVCQPRMPCWKIDEHLGAEGIAAYVDAQCLTGWYCRVLKPGLAAETDGLVLCDRVNPGFDLVNALRLCAEHRPDLDALDRLASLQGIAASWAAKITKRAAYLRRI